MKKADIVKILRAKKEKTLKAFESKNASAKEALKKHLFDQIMQDNTEDLTACLSQLKEIIGKMHKNATDLQCSFYYSALMNFGVLDAESTIRRLYEATRIYKTEAAIKFEAEYQDKHKAIEAEYNKLICVIQSLPSAKIALEYLKELGIELEELPTEPAQWAALTTPINVRLLM